MWGWKLSNLGNAMYPYPGYQRCVRPLIVVDMQNQFIRPQTEHLISAIELFCLIFKDRDQPNRA